jgi:hypothetical protein
MGTKFAASLSPQHAVANPAISEGNLHKSG